MHFGVWLKKRPEHRERVLVKEKVQHREKEGRAFVSFRKVLYRV